MDYMTEDLGYSPTIKIKSIEFWETDPVRT